MADRQSRIPGFFQERLSDLDVLCIGAGGLGSHIGEALVRKGVGRLVICDGDTVHPSNLNRQKFYAADLWKPKGVRLAKNLSSEGFLGTEITGINMNFSEAVQSGLVPGFDLIMSNVDNDLSRERIAEFGLMCDAAVITTAVSEDGDAAYCAIQRPGEACWGCMHPREKRIRDDLANYRRPCPGSPAIKDVLMLVAALAVYAVDAVCMGRPIAWNYRELRLAGFMPSVVANVEKRDNCQLCGPALKDPVRAPKARTTGPQDGGAHARTRAGDREPDPNKRS